MGWLFGKKKVPKVPLPPGRLVDSSSLHFPQKIVREKVIEPEKMGEEAGSREFFTPAMAKRPKMPLPVRTMEPELPLEKPADNFFYVKVEVYRRILGELNGLKAKVGELSRINKHLESSEYNEEHNFDKLSKGVKNLHDRLLQVDKRLFKR